LLDLENGSLAEVELGEVRFRLVDQLRDVEKARLRQLRARVGRDLELLEDLHPHGLIIIGNQGFLSGFGPGQLSSFMPSWRPISASSSLISLSDLRPKFLVLSISDSVFWTSSPMYLMLAFCKQFAERTLSSSSSTVRHRFSLSFS